MIIVNEIQPSSIFLSSTMKYEEDDFKFIITSTANLNTLEIIITRQDSTYRYDRFIVDPVTDEIPVNNYDFVIVENDFAGDYTQIMDILLNYPNAVIQTGKFAVRSNDNTPIIEYQTEKVGIIDYEPENI